MELKQDFSYIKNVFWMSSGKFDATSLTKLLSIFMAEEEESVVSKPSPVSDSLCLLYQKDKCGKKPKRGRTRPKQESERTGKTGEPEVAKSS